VNRLRCGRSADSDGRSLPIAGPGQHAAPRHSTAPNEERDSGRARVDRVEGGGDSRRTGPRAGRRLGGAKMYRWRLVTFQCQQTTVTELFRNDSFTLLFRIGSNRVRIDVRIDFRSTLR
jgi:hypothetical protein